MTDYFKKFYQNLDSPALYAFSVTPDDTANLEVTSRSLYIGGAGDVSVEMAGDNSNVIFSSVNSSTILPIRVLKVHATGTTANGIVGLY